MRTQLGTTSEVEVLVGGPPYKKKKKSLPPPWLQTLLKDKFFNACISHQEYPKNETNFYCVTCCATLCHYCLPLHHSHSHHLLQIRRYMYHYVIRLDAATQLMDCSSIQPYINNSAKVVFLKERPRAQPQIRHHRVLNSTTKCCLTCRNTLQDHYLYCSISCKIDHVLETEGELSKFLRSCKDLTLSPSDDALMTSDDSSGSSDTILSTALSAINFTVKKKRRSTGRSNVGGSEPPPPPHGLEVELTTAPTRPCRAPWRKQSVPRRAPMV